MSIDAWFCGQPIGFLERDLVGIVSRRDRHLALQADVAGGDSRDCQALFFGEGGAEVVDRGEDLQRHLDRVFLVELNSAGPTITAAQLEPKTKRCEVNAIKSGIVGDEVGGDRCDKVVGQT